jgi:hypothetical protein
MAQGQGGGRLLFLNKSYHCIDWMLLYADVALEILMRKVNEQVPKLQMWLFIQNQRYHGVDVSKFCGAKGGLE